MDADGPVLVASTVLAFNPAGALRTPPSLTVTPPTNLVDGQTVNVSVTPATDPEALDGTVVVQCTEPMATFDDLLQATGSCAFDIMTDLVGPAGGTAVGTVTVSAYVNTPMGPVDCRAVTSTCVLFTYDPVFQTLNVPLTFDENGPAQPALLTRPSTGPYDPLHPLGPTTYDLVGFTPSDPFTVRWCNTDGGCLAGVIASGTLDANGMASFTDDDSFFGDGNDDTTCTQGCSMVATDAHGLSATGGGQMITIPPSIGPVGPFRSKQLPVHVSPNKGLHDGDTVTVTASGFAPGATVSIVECDGNAVSVGIEACDLNTSTFLNGSDLTADAHGNVTSTYAIKRHITTPKDGPLDCASSNVDPDAYLAGVAADPSRASITAPSYFSCVIVVADVSNTEQSGGSPIAFEGAKFRRLP